MLILGIKLPRDELEAAAKNGRLGNATHIAIRKFLKDYDVIQPDTLREDTTGWLQWLMERLEKSAREKCVVRGVIRNSAGEVFPWASVKVFRQSLPSLNRNIHVGEAIVLADGTFAFGCDPELLLGSGQSDAGLLFQVHSGLLEVAIEQVIFTKGSEARSETFPGVLPELKVEIVVDAPEANRASEHEGLLAAIAPFLDAAPLSGLTDEDIAFLASKSGFDRSKIELARMAAHFARMSRADLPAEALYGLARKNVPLVEQQLATLGRAALRRALSEAVNDRLIASSFRERIDEIVERLIRLGKSPLTASFQLRDCVGDAVSHAAVQVSQIDSEGQPQHLGAGLSDSHGMVTATYFTAADAPPARLRLSVRRADATEAVIVEAMPEPGQTVTPVRVPLLRAWAASEIAVSAPVAERLEAQGLGTLASIRRRSAAGGSLRARISPEDAEVLSKEDLDIVGHLEAHADLSRISPDAKIRSAAIDKGFATVDRIAAMPRADLVSQLGDTVGDFAALRLHDAARASRKFADNLVAELLADPAHALVAEAEVAAVCNCDDCNSAVGLLAYYADLLRYATGHLRNGTELVTGDFLARHFHQPFADLPASCETSRQQVREIRLVVETMRSYLKATPPDAPAQAVLDASDAACRLAVYQDLLLRTGTSYEEIRRLRSGTPAERKALADRLGISLTAPAPAEGDEIAQLFLDPSPGAPASSQISEANLEALFGLADTRRDPLCDAAKFGDGDNQIPRWNLAGVNWGRNTAPNGSIFIALEKLPATGEVRVEAFADPYRTQRVAQATAPGSNARVALAPDGGSGLYGTFDLKVTTGTSAPANAENILRFARALAFLTVRLLKADRIDEGVQSASDAIAPFRQAANAGANRMTIAQDLYNLSTWLSGPSPAGAVAPVQGAVDVLRGGQPAPTVETAYRWQLGECLTTLAVRQIAAGRMTDGVASATETIVALNQAVAVGADRIAAAQNLHILSSWLAPQRPAEAVAPMEAAVNILRGGQPAPGQHAAYRLLLADSLYGLVVRLIEAKRVDEAVLVAAKAIEAYRQAATAGANRMVAATWLNHLSDQLAGKRRHAEAVAPVEAAVEILRAGEPLAGSQAAYRLLLATSLSGLTLRLIEAGRLNEALPVAVDAVAGFRQAAVSGADRMVIATDLQSLSGWLAHVPRPVEALPPMQAAVEILRGFNPSPGGETSFRSALAQALHGLAIRLMESGRRSEALPPARESRDIYGVLAEQNPTFRASHERLVALVTSLGGT
jgi:hypothetical protein